MRSSTSLSGGFNLAAHRSTGFGSPDDDLRRAHLAPRARGTAGSRFRSGFGIAALTSPSPGTPWPVFRNVRQDAGHTPFHALPACSRLVSGSFHLPLRGTFQLSVTLLVRYRSRDVFRVGSLCLPPSREISDPRYSGTSGLSLIGLPLRDYHPLWCGIPADFGFTFREYQSPNPTSLLPFGKRFGLPCAVFGRPYSRHRYCFLFLRVLRCFNSPRSRSQWDRYGFTRSRRSHSGILGSKAPCAYPRLIAAWHALLRRPSQAIHQTAWACRVLLRSTRLATTGPMMASFPV